MSNEWKTYAAIVAVGYLCGAVSWAVVIAKLKGVDIRKTGSGNPGATNVTRVLGKKWGVLCFFLDFLKGLIPTSAAVWLLDELPGAAVCAGAAAVAGHMWPVFLKFKGGKGVSTTAGVLAALAPFSLILSGALWGVVFKLFRYVSLASVLAAIALPLSAFVLDTAGIYPLPVETIVVLTALSALSILKHAGNIKRLANGTENKFGKRKKGDDDESGGA